MIICPLVDRIIRRAMTDAGLTDLSLYPGDRGCTAPTTARSLESFTVAADNWTLSRAG